MGNKRKKRARGSVVREDYRAGGRVGFREGDEARKEYLDRQRRNDMINLTNNVDGGGKPFTPGVTTPTGEVPVTGEEPVIGNPGILPETKPVDTPKKKKRKLKARDAMQRALEGDTSFMPQIGDPKLVEEGELLEADSIEKKEDITAATAKAPEITDAQQVTQTQQAQTPDQLTAKTFDAKTVDEAADVQAASGEVSDKAQAEAAKVERVDPIEAAEVEIIPGALTERVVGTLSDGSKAQAAQIAGTTLARVTRAKRQLSKAGLTPEDITELGNDPETLEARLMEFTDTQRGLIAGLPEEALVSNQLDSLLTGIEEGEIPTWAKPAVSAVERMLAQRGMEASTVGRDALFNAIIQSAVPMAQANAQAIQQNIAQEKTADIRQAEFNQQTALQNASNVFQMDMAQFSADQQTALSNSKFLQTVGLTEASNRQQATIQNAVLMSQANLAEADFYQKAQINNANAFLQMDMQNLNNQQQANMIRSQNEQQILLSNQAATNAARQFNAQSENQTQQFMASLESDIEKFNTQQLNSVAMFNVEQNNTRDALAFQVEADLEKANAQMINNIKQYNAEREFNRERFNVENARIVDQSNLAWRRQVNTVNTAAQNEVNMQNSINSFNISSQALSFMWQELRDEADYAFKASENEKSRINQLIATAIASDPDRYSSYTTQIANLAGFFSTSVMERGR